MTRSKQKPKTLKEKLADSHYQPTKAELEEDVSIDATPEALADAVLKGGADPKE